MKELLNVHHGVRDVMYQFGRSVSLSSLVKPTLSLHMKSNRHSQPRLLAGLFPESNMGRSPLPPSSIFSNDGDPLIAISQTLKANSVGSTE